MIALICCSNIAQALFASFWVIVSSWFSPCTSSKYFLYNNCRFNPGSDQEDQTSKNSNSGFVEFGFCWDWVSIFARMILSMVFLCWSSRSFCFSGSSPIWRPNKMARVSSSNRGWARIEWLEEAEGGAEKGKGQGYGITEGSVRRLCTIKGDKCCSWSLCCAATCG